MASILITGGAGFIGSHLAHHLLEQGHHVICLDNYFTSSRKTILPLMNYDNFEVLRHDITQPLIIEVDQIYNLACPASPKHYQFDPVQTIKTCVMGAINVLELANRLNVPVLHASTSEVYGDPKVHPQPESYWGHVNPIGLRSCYDEGKRCAETLCYDFHRQYLLDVKIARIFNTYGPHMAVDDGRVISNFIVQALRGDPLTIYGDGSQTRSFCFVKDLVKGLVAWMNKGTPNPGPINFGNPEERNMLQVAQTILKLTHSSSKIEHHPLPENDPKRRRPDITMAKNEIDWTPMVSLEEGLIETISYFKRVLNYTQKS